MSINNFGRDVKALRTKRRIGSRELSRMIGKGETYISQLERGLIKKPDYNTSYSIMKHLGFTESDIEEFLYNFYQIKSPDRIETEVEEVADWEESRAAEIEQIWVHQQKGIGTNSISKNDGLSHNTQDFESKWMMELIEKLELKNNEIKNALSFNIDKNAQTFEPIITNLLSLLTSMRSDRGNFNFFVDLFKDDLSLLTEESKNKILKAVTEEVDKSKENSRN